MYSDGTYKDQPSVNQASIFDELDEKRVAPQRFGVAIAVGVVVTALSYSYYFVGSRWQGVLDVTDAAMGTYLLVFFRLYLRNFRATSAIRWASWGVVLNVITLVLLTLKAFIGALSHQGLLDPESLRTFNGILMPVLGVVALADLVVMIGQGVTLQKIHNDHIGLLRPLGIVLAFVLPAGFLITAVAEFSRLTSGVLTGQLRYTLYILLFENTLNKLPDLMMIVIFYRAMNYVQRQNIQ